MKPKTKRATSAQGRAAEAPHDDAFSAVQPALPKTTRERLGSELRGLYADLIAEPQPARLLELIAQLEERLAGQISPTAATFRTDLIAALPALRTFAMSLAANASRVDDLVQDTVLKAWQAQQSFQPGTNFKAWLFTIMRNLFYSELRKRKREVEDANGEIAGQLIALPDQEDRSELREVWKRLSKLTPLQREALLLIGAHEMTYEEAAALIGCQVGTVKSRVSRARADLAHIMRYTDGRLGRAYQ